MPQLFFISAGGKNSVFCLAGTEFPIGLPEARWRESVGPVRSAPAVSRFGPWALPGFGAPLAYWMSSELHVSDDHLSFILLGTSSTPWKDEDGGALSSIALTIAPIVDIRIETGARGVRTATKPRSFWRRAKKRLRSFFEDSRDMIYTTNSEDIVTSINAAGLVLTGRSEKHEVLGHPFSALVPQRG